jgi:hypothetical protein
VFARLYGFAGQNLLFCATTKSINVFDLTEPACPKLRLQQSNEGTTSLLVHPTGVLLCGESGVNELLLMGQRPISSLPLSHKTLLAAGHYGRYRYLLESGLVTIYTDRFLEKGRFASEDAKLLTIVGSVLVLTNPDANSFYSLRDPEKPVKISSMRASSVSRILQPNGLPRPNTLYSEQGNGQGQLIDISRSREPVVLATYNSTPWFVDFHRHGALAVRAEPGTREVYIHTVASIKRRQYTTKFRSAKPRTKG